MDGTNSAGRKVSLLNDHEPSQLVRLPSFPPSLRSRTSSYASSSIGSPPTPQLVRSNSSDSTSMQTPSPITPDYYGEGLGSPVFHQNSFFQQPQEPKEMSSAYPQLPQGPVALPYHPHPHSAHPEHAAYFAQQAQQTAQEHHSTPRAPPAPASAAASTNGRPKKNQYPCPMAKLYNCNDHFTTSGHAARHAKKHTGKKDAVCPECNKAFTRKDNMEQHRRTHNTGRAHARNTERDAKKAKQRAQRPKPSPLQSSTPVMSPASVVDPALPISPTGSFMSQPVQPVESFVDFSSVQRSYPDPTVYAINYNYNPQSPSCGLDALAIAADGIDQRYEP